MLLITRRAGEKIMVGDDIVVHVMEIVGNTVRVGIEAPRSTPIYREEIWNVVRDENRAAAEAAPFELPVATPARSSHRGRLASGLRPRPRSGYGLGMDFAKTARNLAVADIALAFARDRVAAHASRASSRASGAAGRKTLLIGGGVAAAAAALLFKRDEVDAPAPRRQRRAAPRRAGATRRRRCPTTTPPGPVANTATAVPVPPAFEEPAIDEAAEEAAAAAEAANIGGTGLRLRRPRRRDRRRGASAPLAEAGEGESEGQEQTEDELRDAAEGRGRRLSPEEAQIDDAIEQAANPLAGERSSRSSRRDDGDRVAHLVGTHTVSAEPTRQGSGCRGGVWNREDARPATARIGHNTAEFDEHARGHAAQRPVPARRPDRCGRDVDGLSGLRRQPRAPGGDQAPAPGDVGGLRPAGALQARGARGRAALASAHRRRDRRRRGREPALHRLRVRRGRDAQGPHPPARAAAGRRVAGLRDRDRPRARAAPTRTRSCTATSSRRTSCWTPEGSAKVTDFGIARSLRDDGLTADGRVLGTTDYVSPEQALGHDVDGQSDIYSLGVVLFEMLTGRRPVPRREPDRGRDEARPRGPAGHPARSARRSRPPPPPSWTG